MAYIKIFPLTKEPIQDPRGGWINFTDVSIDTNPKFQHLLTSHDFVILNQADELAALRAENAKLREALSKIHMIASCAPHDDEELASQEFHTIMNEAHRALESSNE